MTGWPIPPLNGNFEINKLSSQYRNLVFWMTPSFGPGRRQVNLIRREIATEDIGAGGSLKPIQRFGYGVNFSGVNPQRVRFSRYPAVEPPGTYFTLSVWIYVSLDFVALYYNTAGIVTFFTGHSGTIDTLTGAADLDNFTGQLVHIVGRMGPAASNNKQIYVNGLFDSQKTRTANVVYDTTSGGDLAIGANFRGIPTDRVTDVTVLDARIYNRYLSDAEIWRMYAPSSRFDLYSPLAFRLGAITIGPSKAGNIYNIQSESRIHNILAESRIYNVLAESRIYEVQ
jgi:hypothetical protein